MITGSPSDPRLVWVRDNSSGRELPLVWPPNWTARFDPKLEVINPSGVLRFRDGDQVTGGCVEGPGVLMLSGLQ